MLTALARCCGLRHEDNGLRARPRGRSQLSHWPSGTEALKLPVQPAEPVIALRGAIRAAIADVWGCDGAPEDAEGFRPHVSLAYSNSSGPAEPITERVAARSVTAAETTIHRVALIDLNRDHRAYRWTEIAAANLGASAQ